MSIPKTHRAAVITGPNEPFKIMEVPTPTPGKNEVLIKVIACGVCHSDCFTVFGAFPGIQFPRIPGHEVIGRVVAHGNEVHDKFKTGALVGVGWTGGHCFYCENCRHGDFVTCTSSPVTGIHVDGGYQEYTIAREEALAQIPEDVNPVEYAPLLCAGITVFNSLRNVRAFPGDLVAIHGIGGLGHYAVQIAAKMGYRVAVISTNDSKRSLATELGAHIYLDSSKQDVVKELNNLGGAKIICTTVMDGKAVSPLVDGLAMDGTLLVLGAAMDPLQISAFSLIGKRAKVMGWPSGSAIDSEETVKFAKLINIKSMVKSFKLDEAQQAYDAMMANQVRFRAVITFD